MAEIGHELVNGCIKKLANFVEGRAVMVLRAGEDLRTLQKKLVIARAAVEEAEGRKIQGVLLKKWLVELRSFIYDAEDVLDLCIYHGSKLLEGPSPASPNPLVSCHSLLLEKFCSLKAIPFRNKIGLEIRELNNKLDSFNTQMSQLGLARPSSGLEVQLNGQHGHLDETSPQENSYVVGREIEEATKELMESLLSENEEGQRILVFAIVGMGGIGKTTLAQKIYNHQRIVANFQLRIWISVSKTFSGKEILQQFIRDAGGHYGEAKTMAELKPKLTSILLGKKFLLVLDNVWQAADVWEKLLQTPLEQEGIGGRILVTCRSEEISRGLGAVKARGVNKLTTDEGWELLRKNVAKVGNENEIQNLQEIGKKIVERCDGLPLAIKCMAGVLREKGASERDWQYVHDDSKWSFTTQLPEEIHRALYISYEDLPPYLKGCFLYTALFPQNHRFIRSDIVPYWVAEGFIGADDTYLEDTAERYFDELIRRSFLQPDPNYLDNKVCVMHDHIRTLALVLTEEEIYFGDGKILTTDRSAKLRRLSIDYKPEITCLPEPTKLKSLRTLMLYRCSKITKLEKRLFKISKRLRVLQLTGTGIDSIPDSVGTLIHLRLLDLDSTGVQKLPESIGCLANLQTLNISRCRSLKTLPLGITRLCGLRRLGLERTPLNHLPKGIGRLKHLNDLDGFDVGSSSSSAEQQQHGCGLDELEPLIQLKHLRIEKLEKAISGSARGVLSDKTKLTELVLSSTPQGDPGQLPQAEQYRMQQIYEDLCPSPKLEFLVLINFFGLNYPVWMSGSLLLTSLPKLTKLHLYNCTSCRQLPPLGQLPLLKILRIAGAAAVVTIGPEFLVGDVMRVSHAARLTPFPKLEFLMFQGMPNWDNWSCEVFETGNRRASFVLFPRLNKLEIKKCPKLKSLPEGLGDTLSGTLHIEGAHSLEQIQNFSCLTEWLHIIDSRELERISDLPVLKRLIIDSCPALTIVKNLGAVESMVIRSCSSLEHVENLQELQHLNIEDDSAMGFPEWLLRILQRQRQEQRDVSLQALRMTSSPTLLGKCIDGGQYWPIIQQIPQVSIATADGLAYMEYCRKPPQYSAKV